MKIIVFTSSDKIRSELPIVIEMFKEGLDTLHLRKPKFSTRKLKEYLDAIPEKYHNRIIIHSHHKLALKYNLKGIHLTRVHLKQAFKCRVKILLYRLRKPSIVISRSFRHLEGLTLNKMKYSYAFLNPIFSKTDPKQYNFDVSVSHLNKVLKNNSFPVYASGNITDENIELLRKIEINGIALSKIIWDSNENQLQKFLSLRELLESETRS